MNTLDPNLKYTPFGNQLIGFGCGDIKVEGHFDDTVKCEHCDEEYDVDEWLTVTVPNDYLGLPVIDPVFEGIIRAAAENNIDLTNLNTLYTLRAVFAAMNKGKDVENKIK